MVHVVGGLMFIRCRFFGLFFFFQAEDGIRDGHVTGVQTCALPILLQLNATDTLFKAGPVAVGGWNDLAEFDNVRVVSLGGPPPPPSPVVTRVVVSPSTLTLSVGAKDSLTASEYDASGNVITGRTVFWGSSNAAIARISALGKVA